MNPGSTTTLIFTPVFFQAQPLSFPRSYPGLVFIGFQGSAVKGEVLSRTRLGASDIRSSGIPDIGHGDSQVGSWQDHLVFLIHPRFLLFSPPVFQFTISIPPVLSRVHTFHHTHDSRIYLVYRNVFLIFLMFYLSPGLWPSRTLYIALLILAVLSPV